MSAQATNASNRTATSTDEEHGPFHRLKSPTQSDATATQQLKSSELWGHPRQHSNIPQVQAYEGVLPTGAQGMEIYTSTAPDQGTAPGQVRWTGPRRSGVHVEDDFAKIRVRISKDSQNAAAAVDDSSSY
jgi:esterase/lipase superfamily enzyme